MLVRTPIEAIDDILTTIDDIGTLVGKHDLATYAKDIKTKRAIERSIEIISEAARHIPPIYTDLYPQIPWRQVWDIGNLLRHEYAEIADPIIWGVIKDHLKPLKKACEAIRIEVSTRPRHPEHTIITDDKPRSKIVKEKSKRRTRNR
jgi:uncharacterized protein with HEPN domain